MLLWHILLTCQNKLERYLLLSIFYKSGNQGSEVKSMWDNMDVAQNLAFRASPSKQNMAMDVSG